ncbi:MBL fold metallo-hydrolase [Oscillospiraceae bacterium PP1C4]
MQLTKRIYLVGSGWAGSNFTDSHDCDIYLVDCGEKLVLIDAGLGTGDNLILDEIRRHGFRPEDIAYILLTHGHADHAGGACGLREATGATVLAHPDCARYITAGDTKAIALDEAIKAGIYPADYKFAPCPVGAIGDGEQLRVGEVTFTAYSTPGHCSGHHAYLMEAQGASALFAGDSVFPGGKISLQALWDCSIVDYMQTVQKLLTLHFDALLPSHFGIDIKNGMQHIQTAAEIFATLEIPGQAGRGY